MAKRRRHKRTESQAVTELENVFKSVDLEGDGKLDMASFQTAMFSLDVMVDDEKMENLFQSVDTEGEGAIDYEQFLKLLRSGALGGDDLAQEVMESARMAPASALPSLPNTKPVSKNPMPLPSPRKFFDGPSKFRDKGPWNKLDPKKKSVIQRAVIVIKKAAMKNISREEVVEFLKDKGMKLEDINYAYEKAQEQAMSPEERIRYLKTQCASKDKELKDQKAFTRHLSDQVAEKSKQITQLQKACEKAAARLTELDGKKDADVDCPDGVLREVKSAISKLQSNMKGDSKSNALFTNDLTKLTKVQAALGEKKYFTVYLWLQSLEAVDLNTMHKTNAFFDEFNIA